MSDYQYVDVESELWTKRLKRFAIVRMILKSSLLVFEIICVISLMPAIKIMSEYFINPDMVMDVVWTNSQITGLFCMLFLCGIIIVFGKMISKIMRGL